MNFKKFYNIVIIIIIIFFSGCSKNTQKIKKPEKIPPLDILYKSAYNYYLDGDFSSSIQLFQKVENRYSYSEWAPRATLMIMYMYYESGKSYETLEYAKKFKKTYPVSSSSNYVSFIEALTFYDQINIISRYQTYRKTALRKFQEIIKQDPSSIYAEESKLKIDLINEQLAGKEMYLARYYMQKSKWIAAIKRLNIILDQYQTTIYSKEALHRLVEIYYKLGNLDVAKKYAAILGYNFNDSDWYKKSYKIIKKKNYSVENIKTKKKLKDRIKKVFNFSK